jgi:hypothetical protein
MITFNEAVNLCSILINLKITNFNDATIAMIDKKVDIVIFSDVLHFKEKKDITLVIRDFIEFIDDFQDIVYVIDDETYPINITTRLLVFLTPIKLISLRYLGDKDYFCMNIMRGIIKYDIKDKLLKECIYEGNTCYKAGTIYP